MFGCLRTIKSGILKKIHGINSGVLLNQEWTIFYNKLPHNEVVLWGSIRYCKQYISRYNVTAIYDPDLEQCSDLVPSNILHNKAEEGQNSPGVSRRILRKYAQKKKHIHHGIPLVTEQYFADPRKLVVLVADESYGLAIRTLSMYGSNQVYAVLLMDSPRKIWGIYRALIETIKKVPGFCKWIVKWIGKLPYKLIFDQITPRYLRDSITWLGYKQGSAQLRKKTWQEFYREAEGKKVVLLGTRDAFMPFLQQAGSRYHILCAVDWKGGYLVAKRRKTIQNVWGVPIYTPDRLLRLQKRDDLVYLITATEPLGVNTAIAFLEQNGISEYYSCAAMSANLFKYRMMIPVYLLKRYLYFAKRKFGFFDMLRFDILSFLRWLHFPPACKGYTDIRKLKDRHKDQRCFIVATGASLTVEDAEKLEGEITFGVNRLFSLYERTDWRPTYYLIMDHKAIPQYQREGHQIDLDAYSLRENFISECVKKYNNVLGTKTITLPFTYLNHDAFGTNWIHRPSADLFRGLNGTGSVVQACMEIASYMGFSEIYLLGTDCDYTSKLHHFDNSANWFATDIERSLCINMFMQEGFEHEKQWLDQRGIKAYNATRGGALEVFPRVDLDDIIKRNDNNECSADYGDNPCHHILP